MPRPSFAKLIRIRRERPPVETPVEVVAETPVAPKKKPSKKKAK